MATITDLFDGGGRSSAGLDLDLAAFDVYAPEGGVLTKRGPVSVHQHPGNGFSLVRQHFGSGDHRPAPSEFAYPRGLVTSGIGAASDGYGSADSGASVIMNLDRAREGVYVTQSWWWGIKAKQPGAVGVMTFGQDTEGWGSLSRSYFRVEVDLATGAMRILGDDETWITLAVTVPVPGWNDNKYDRTYSSLTTWIGPSTATGTMFGHYVCFQQGAQVIDLRGAGGGSADFPPQTVLTGSSFSGGRNPFFTVTTPLPNNPGGIVLYEMVETIGDSIAA